MKQMNARTTGLHCFAVLAAVLAAATLLGDVARGADDVISLAGRWQFVRGGPALELHPGVMPALKLVDSITLPATSETARKGAASDDRSTDGLSHPWAFVGPCWYQRDVVIPESWRAKRVTLFLERSKYSQCWLDGKPLGQSEIVCTPQEYVLGTDLEPGRHQLTLAVDNSRLHPYGADSHQYSGATQGNWNGVIGRIELAASPVVRIDDVQVYPSAADRQVAVTVSVAAVAASAAGAGTLDLAVTGPGVASSAGTNQPIRWSNGTGVATFQIKLGADAALWDEFHPNLEQLTVHFHGQNAEDQRQVSFGLRTFATEGRQFTINGRPTFLRGKHDACVFPLTGHPPMDVAGWAAYLRTCRSYGLNHIRFHTWVPPEAAFAAADQLGFLLQPELPYWGNFDAAAKAALEPEAMAMLRRLGNHPSFVMFSMGNEHWGNADVLASLVAELKSADPRHLYVRGTNAISWQGRPGPGDDYLIAADAWSKADGQIRPVRGANAGSGARAHIQFGPPQTTSDYSAAIAGNTWPTVTHEMGQYTVYPDFNEIAAYTGVSRAHNFEQMRDHLGQAGLGEQDQAFARASGALAEIGYREEIESCLRTPDYGGFELLDLQDYPGQGTALVGMLDAFMHSKGIVQPTQWRQFCSPTVLLARLPKYVWTTDESFGCEIDLAQYSEADLPDTTMDWRLCDGGSGAVLRSGSIPANQLRRGNLRPIGRLTVPLAGLVGPAALRLELSLAKTAIATQYPVWVYPPHVETAPPARVQVVRWFDDGARAALNAGGRVLLVCDADRPLARTVGGGFATDFWGFNFFRNKPGTMGILCDPQSPALAEFPTESHSDWQWFELTLFGQPLVLDSVLPPGSRPIVQVIDNYVRCHELGMIFELRVGNGSLLVCTTDLIKAAPAHPEAKQLLASLLHYADSDRFAPKDAVPVEALSDLFRTVVPMTGCTATASSFDDSWEGYDPKQLIDGNDSRGWRAKKDQAGDCWCQVQFPTPVDFDAVEVLWHSPGPGFDYALEQSTDGSQWKVLEAHCGNGVADERQTVALHGRGITHLRLVVHATPNHEPAAIQEIRFFPPPGPKEPT